MPRHPPCALHSLPNKPNTTHKQTISSDTTLGYTNTTKQLIPHTTHPEHNPTHHPAKAKKKRTGPVRVLRCEEDARVHYAQLKQQTPPPPPTPQHEEQAQDLGPQPSHPTQHPHQADPAGQAPRCPGPPVPPAQQEREGAGTREDPAQPDNPKEGGSVSGVSDTQQCATPTPTTPSPHTQNACEPGGTGVPGGTADGSTIRTPLQTRHDHSPEGLIPPTVSYTPYTGVCSLERR